MRPLLVPLLLALGACATPVAPTGGPADTTPPVLVETSPADGATNVTERTLRLTFSERLASAAGAAVTVTPAGDVPPEVRVRGREIEVTLPALRDSTTYVVTVGTALADQRSVALRAPITVAFATGDVIDRGRIAGVVREPDTGAGVGGLAVWAYALPDTTARPDARAVAPDYRTETGADGAFRLEYLRPGPYAVAVVQDRNRNSRADPGERFAVAPRPVLRATADSATSAPATFWTTALDTIPPVAQRLRPVSDRRLAVRFSEPVLLRDAAAWAASVAVADSASGAAVPVAWYQPAGSAFEVWAEAARPLPAATLVTATPAGRAAVADSAGLGPGPFRLSVAPPARADTVVARFEAFVPSAPDSVVTLRPGQRPGVRFTTPPGPRLDAVRLRTSGEPVPLSFVTADGVTFVADSTVALPSTFALTVPAGDTTRAQRFAVASDREVGAILGRVEGEGPVLVEVRPASGAPVVVRADADGAFVADGLLPGPYTLRVWDDRDGDGRWSGGRLAPYVAPEPLVLLAEPVQVRARWEAEIDPVTLEPVDQ
ncbi:Ig-like domain-containing protein [Rubrivirga sp.]|uniref:Ig-like domain-containing protein n=1 Tax=Rubrivirga sp. TaxID=1885344 RepID=UPI003B528EE4